MQLFCLSVVIDLGKFSRPVPGILDEVRKSTKIKLGVKSKRGRGRNGTTTFAFGTKTFKTESKYLPPYKHNNGKLKSTTTTVSNVTNLIQDKDS